MATMNISLPDPLRDYVDEEVSKGAFSSASEYFRQLIRDDQKRKARERLEELLLEGLESGDPIEITPEWWEEKRARLYRAQRGQPG